jgi:hypothetical protein
MEDPNEIAHRQKMQGIVALADKTSILFMAMVLIGMLIRFHLSLP